MILTHFVAAPFCAEAVLMNTRSLNRCSAEHRGTVRKMETVEELV